MKIGVVLPLAEDERSGRPRSYPELRRMAQAVESAGLDSIWVFDHLFFDRAFVGLAGGRIQPDDPARVGVHEGWTFSPRSLRIPAAWS